PRKALRRGYSHHRSAAERARSARRALLRASHLLRRLARSSQSARSLRALPRTFPTSESGPGMAGAPEGQTAASRAAKIAIIVPEPYGFPLAPPCRCRFPLDCSLVCSRFGAAGRPPPRQRRGLAGANPARAKSGQESEV